MPHIANINWLELYLLSNILLITIIALTSSNNIPISSSPLNYTNTSNNWNW